MPFSLHAYEILKKCCIRVNSSKSSWTWLSSTDTSIKVQKYLSLAGLGELELSRTLVYELEVETREMQADFPQNVPWNVP